MDTNLTTKLVQKKPLMPSPKVLQALAVSAMLGLPGCQTLMGKSSKDDEIKTATTTPDTYLKEAIQDIDDENYLSAINKLKDLRVFYPASKEAKQALLELMQAEFSAGKYEDAIESSKLFLRSYPTDAQVDYALYVQGVAHMTYPHGKYNLFNLNQAERDTSYYKLAFSNFFQMLKANPDSKFAPDAAQRMTYLYNKLAEHELHIAKWYIKREAYVASANRAKKVFQNFPSSESTPDAVAILVHSYDMLGMEAKADEYRAILRTNYPSKISKDGKVEYSSKVKKDLFPFDLPFSKDK